MRDRAMSAGVFVPLLLLAFAAGRQGIVLVIVLLVFGTVLLEQFGLPIPAFPVLVVGSNSIAAYVLAHGFDGYVAKNLTTHLGAGLFRLLGPAFEPLLLGAATLAVLWLVLWWMYRRKLFLRI